MILGGWFSNPKTHLAEWLRVRSDHAVDIVIFEKLNEYERYVKQ